MLIITLCIFIIAALLGLWLLSYVIQNKNTPKGLAFIHGPIAALGIILLLIYAILYSPRPSLSLAFLVLAALGGFLMMFKDLTNGLPPKWLALGHGLLALIGVVLLVLFLAL